ncbi:MAG: hypothetical protein HRT64_06650 [Erythrobacter sp.]|nr:hypothetical protein [Erythrobacter sp.]
MTGAYVKYKSADGRRVTIRARYTYGTQRSRDWVEIRLQDGRAQCVKYGSAGGWEGCKKIGGMGIGQMAAVGAALAVAAGAASAASSGSSSDSYSSRNKTRCDPSDYYIDNNGYARPAC